MIIWHPFFRGCNFKIKHLKADIYLKLFTENYVFLGPELHVLWQEGYLSLNMELSYNELFCGSKVHGFSNKFFYVGNTLTFLFANQKNKILAFCRSLATKNFPIINIDIFCLNGVNNAVVKTFNLNNAGDCTLNKYVIRSYNLLR